MNVDSRSVVKSCVIDVIYPTIVKVSIIYNLINYTGMFSGVFFRFVVFTNFNAQRAFIFARITAELLAKRRFISVERFPMVARHFSRPVTKKRARARPGGIPRGRQRISVRSCTLVDRFASYVRGRWVYVARNETALSPATVGASSGFSSGHCAPFYPSCFMFYQLANPRGMGNIFIKLPQTQHSFETRRLILFRRMTSRSKKLVRS